MTDANLAVIHAAAMRVPRPWRATELHDLRAMPGAIEILRPEGFALGRLVLDEAELLTIAVHPDHHRQGFGQAILSAFHAELRQKHATVCHLEVAAPNHAARALYAANGYTQTGLRRAYYTDTAPAQDAITMTCAL